jgi:hypothetical protein
VADTAKWPVGAEDLNPHLTLLERAALPIKLPADVKVTRQTQRTAIARSKRGKFLRLEIGRLLQAHPCGSPPDHGYAIW